MHERTNERTNEQTNGWMGELMDGGMNDWSGEVWRGSARRGGENTFITTVELSLCKIEQAESANAKKYAMSPGPN
jgi:hypothetical protein